MVGRFGRGAYIHRAEYWGVLGTDASLKIQAATRAQAEQAEGALLGELERLRDIFNRYDPTSELNRWQRGELTRPLSPELLQVLRRAHYWQTLTGGAFHVGADLLGTLWDEAAAAGQAPAPATLQAALTQLALPLELPASGICPPPPYSVNLNALAKGFIVEQAARMALAQAGVAQVQLNIGGDLCHLGSGHCWVGLSDPRTSAMNAPLQGQVRLSNGALASSGHVLRGRSVAGEWHSHLIDPRSGQSVTVSAGCSVIAPSCLDADALSTALSVLPPEEGLALCGQLNIDGQAYAALLTLPDGSTRQSRLWRNFKPFALPIRPLLNKEIHHAS